MEWYDAARRYYRAAGYELAALPTAWQRELVALMLVNREMNNGGYLQFFANHGPEIDSLATKALRDIGATTMAEIVATCRALLGEHFDSDGKGQRERSGVLPNPILGRDGEVEKEPGSTLPDAIVDRVSELSYHFIDYPDDVGPLAERYFSPLIAANPPPE